MNNTITIDTKINISTDKIIEELEDIVYFFPLDFKKQSYVCNCAITGTPFYFYHYITSKKIELQPKMDKVPQSVIDHINGIVDKIYKQSQFWDKRLNKG